MKKHFKRLILRHKLARIAAQLQGLEHEREQLKRLEHHLLVQANLARMQLLMLDIRNRRHA